VTCSVVIGYQRFKDPYCLHVYWIMTCSVVVG